MNRIKTIVEYSTELAFNSNLPNIIVLHLIGQLYSAHVKCDV